MRCAQLDKKRLENAFNLCVKKAEKNMEKIGDELFEYLASPTGNYFENKQEFSHINTWTASFFTGMCSLALLTNGEDKYLNYLNRFYGQYKSKVFDTPMETMHDIGFLYIPYSVAIYKMTGDSKHKSVALKAADELAKRYSIRGEYIRAWGRMDENFDEFGTVTNGLMIIDCMMNIPLLFWASEETGNSFYYDIAVKHADSTLKLMIRDDNSVYHSYRFDPETGRPLGPSNYCGYAVNSYWARGTTWAIYGFALAYSHTAKKEYLETAKKLAYQFIANLDETIIPVWDFRLPDDMPKNKDSSAAAIAACGFMEILKHIPNEQLLIEWTDKLLFELADERYTDYNVECPGVLKECNGNHTYAIFGDYYYMEALAKKLYDVKTFW